jgi:hypothetical protein
MKRNNNLSIHLNSPNISNSDATQLYFYRIYELTKEYINRKRIGLTDAWNSLTFFQKLLFIIIFVGIPFMIIIFLVIRKGITNLNRNLGADYSTLSITNDLPLVSIVSNNNDYKNILEQYLTSYYPSMIKNKSLNYKISHTDLKNDIDGEYTYSTWIYINGNNSGVYNYFNYKLQNSLKTTNNIPNYNWANYRFNKFKNIFIRGDSPDINNLNNIKQYPGIWLGPELTNLYFVFSNGTNSESYLLENLELNKWINITITINNSSISIYKNGYLEITGMISSNLYISNIGKKNLYFMGNPSLDTLNHGYPGFINYFNFYNKVLTPDEIKTLYYNYLTLINDYMKNSITYNIETSPTVNIISEY